MAYLDEQPGREIVPTAEQIAAMEPRNVPDLAIQAKLLADRAKWFAASDLERRERYPWPGVGLPQ